MSLLNWLDETFSANKDNIESITVEIETSQKPLLFSNISELKVDLTKKVLIREQVNQVYGGYYAGMSVTPSQKDEYPESVIRAISVGYKEVK